MRPRTSVGFRRLPAPYIVEFRRRGMREEARGPKFVIEYIDKIELRRAFISILEFADSAGVLIRQYCGVYTKWRFFSHAGEA